LVILYWNQSTPVYAERLRLPLVFTHATYSLFIRFGSKLCVLEAFSMDIPEYVIDK